LSIMRFSLFVIVALATAAVQAGEIRLKAHVESSGPLVRLGDVAEIAADVTADGESLADLALFPAPAGGRTRLLKRQELVELLTLCDIELKGWEFAGAEVVEVKAATTLTRTIVRPALHLIPTRSQVVHEPKTGNKAPATAKADVPPPLVTRNGAVTMHSLAAGIRITTAGKSLADAGKGQSVLVELADSREKVLAQVVGPQLVEIRTGAK
jgi:hypothetical protein